MKKNTLKLSILVSLLFVLSLVFFNQFKKKQITNEPYNEYQEEAYEEEPEDEFLEAAAFDSSELEGEALIEYNQWREALEASGYKFTDFDTLVSSTKSFFKKASTLESIVDYSYANNTITGSWTQKNMVSDNNSIYNDDNGYRSDGSAYDPVNEVLYVVSTPGHLYKIDENSNIKWSLRNHKKNLRGDDFTGINLPDNSFRLLHQKPNGAMEFSDDEGRNWVDANGAIFQSSWNYKTIVTKTPTGRRIVAHGGSYVIGAAYERLFISTNYGLNYTESSFRFKKSDFKVTICKPHNSNSVYCFVRRNSDSKIFIYRMGENDKDFSLILEPTQTFTGVESVFGSLVNGVTHFYISTRNQDIFYSSDEGATWTQTSNNNDRNLVDVHPTQPNICFKGFLELFKSTDYGATWTRNFHYLKTHYVWDLQYMKTYDKESGGNFTFVGTDFGSFYSTNPSNWNSWVSINSGSPNVLAYDAASSDLYNKTYTANQDRGAHGFIDDDGGNGIYETINEANTDILRVALAKNESSIWFWYYTGNIGRNDVVSGGGADSVVRRDFYSNWWATSMIPSPDPNEDAIYIPAGGSQLNKFNYDGNTIVRTFHPFVFSGPPISFGYSQLNTNRWYVGLKTGSFMYSTNGGATFTQSSYSGIWPGQDDSYKKTRTVIATSPTQEATVYFAGKGNRFLISNDGGVTFSNHNSGLSVFRIMDMDVSPDGKYVFAACGTDGPWIYAINQDRWFKMTGSDVPEVVEFTDAQFIASKNLIRFATYGSGVLDFSINESLLSVEENITNKLGDIKILPNPTSGIFEITIPKFRQEVVVDLYSETGAIISKKIYRNLNGKVTLNIKNQAAGIYYAKVFLDKPMTLKVVKR